MLRELLPDRALYAPGDEAIIEAWFEPYPLPPGCRLVLELWRDRDRVAVEERHLAAGAVGPNPLQVGLRLPAGLKGGFGVEARLLDPGGGALGRAGTAVDAWEGWWERPRYGFVTDFAPGAGTDGLVTFRRFHLNVAQFYDWMYRHHRYLPPQDVFRDPLGRRLSLATVRRKVRACRAAGVAPLGYGAVYGAEPSLLGRRPGWGLYHRDGRPQMLGDFLAIMDPSPGTGWRRLLLRQYELAIREVGFSGIHMDQYGGPRRPYRHDARAVELRRIFPGLIDQAARRVRAVDPLARVIFNHVKAWPLEETARADQAALYIEAWPPDRSYADLAALIRRARTLRPDRQVILAAYISPLRRDALDPEAENAALATSAVIHAAGGFHLFLGEGDAGLCHAYYPNYARLGPRLLEGLRRHYDFITRYSHRLFAEPARMEEEPQPGRIWPTRTGDVRHQVSLRGLTHGQWNRRQAYPLPLGRPSREQLGVTDVWEALEAVGPDR